MAEIMHFSHTKHGALHYNTCPNRELTCDMCKGPIKGCEKIYQCLTMKNCVYTIHKRCSDLPQQLTTHPLHALDHHSLTLSNPTTFTNSALCGYCDAPLFSLGQCFAYTCDKCPDFHLHMACSTVPIPSFTVAPDESVRFSCHRRPMELLKDPKGSGEPAWCFACRSPRSGPAYSCHECDNFFHQSCIESLPQLKTSHPLHPRHPLKLEISRPRPCDSCSREDSWLGFVCSNKPCGFNLCSKCASASDPTTVDCWSHDHSLNLLTLSLSLRCNACQKSYRECSFSLCSEFVSATTVDCRGTDHVLDLAPLYLSIECERCQRTYKERYDGLVLPEEVDQTKSLLFRCMEMGCSFDVHFLCGPLPAQVKYEYHIHPLVLVEAFATGEEDSDEHYCDACEEERDPEFRVYYCRECKYVAHIHCVHSEIMKVIKEDTEHLERFIALGEDQWEELKDDEDQGFTMMDIINTLTYSEKYKLTNLIDDSVVAMNLLHYFEEPNSRLLDRSFNAVQRLFQLSGYQYEFFIREAQNFATLKGWKLEDKYLRQKVRDVQGCKVPKTLAPIFKTLLTKYGDDLRFNSPSLTPAMKSFASTLLCAVIEKMSRTKVEDTTRDDIRYWFMYLKCVYRILESPVLKKFLYYLENIYIPAFIGNEANRSEQETLKIMDHKIKALEAELKMCKDFYENLKKCRSGASYYMKLCLRNASDLRGKYYIRNLLDSPWLSN